MGLVKFVRTWILNVAVFLLVGIIILFLSAAALVLLGFCVGIPVGIIWWVAAHVVSWLP